MFDFYLACAFVNGRWQPIDAAIVLHDCIGEQGDFVCTVSTDKNEEHISEKMIDNTKQASLMNIDYYIMKYSYF